MFFTIENPDIKLISELERANAAKDSFISSMSHQIKTPLNIIVGLSTVFALSSAIIVLTCSYFATAIISSSFITILSISFSKKILIKMVIQIIVCHLTN